MSTSTQPGMQSGAEMSDWPGSPISTLHPMPLGSVSHKLLHLARRPVLIVPRHSAANGEPAGAGQAAKAVAG